MKNLRSLCSTYLRVSISYIRRCYVYWLCYKLTWIFPLHVGHTSANLKDLPPPPSRIKTSGWRSRIWSRGHALQPSSQGASDWSWKLSHTLAILRTWPFSWNWFVFHVDEQQLVTWLATAPPCDRHPHGPRLRCRADATAERLGPEHGAALLALSRCGPQSLQRDQHISKHVLLSQELYCLVTRDLHPEMRQSRKMKL